MNLSFRTVTENDFDFLLRVSAGTREQEKALFRWADCAWDRFIRMQFALQHQYYRQQFPEADYAIIYLGGTPVGRLYVNHGEDEIRIIDIALLPEFRNRGIGTGILRSLISRAENQQISVRLFVEQSNPSLRLYHRLGFRARETAGVYYHLERPPAHPLSPVRADTT